MSEPIERPVDSLKRSPAAQRRCDRALDSFIDLVLEGNLPPTPQQQYAPPTLDQRTVQAALGLLTLQHAPWSPSPPPVVAQPLPMPRVVAPPVRRVGGIEKASDALVATAEWTPGGKKPAVRRKTVKTARVVKG